MAPPHLYRPTVADARAAAVKIKGKAIRPPGVRLNYDGGPDAPEIYLKLENLQPIGSFKVRPGANAMALAGTSVEKGVTTCSAGNFGQGLAWCAKERGVPCTIVCPDTTPTTKAEAMERRGARIIRVPYSEWWKIIETHECPQAEGHFIHPGCEQAVLSGNGTIGLEIIEDVPDVDAVVIPYGSGAVATGVAAVVKELRPSVKTYAVEPETACPFALSRKAGRPVAADFTPSFVDGCGGKSVLEPIFDIAREVLDEGLAIPLDEAAKAIRLVAERNRVICEGAGACPVAAALAGRCKGARKIVCVVSGGGLDNAKLSQILNGEDPSKPSPSSSSPPMLSQATLFALVAGVGLGMLLMRPRPLR
jgi:threonine dehydratase